MNLGKTPRLRKPMENLSNLRLFLIWKPRKKDRVNKRFRKSAFSGYFKKKVKNPAGLKDILHIFLNG
jgi:hypothetical protein